MNGIEKNSSTRLAYYRAVIASVLLVGALLLPQGVGIRLPFEFPKLDLPRLSMLALLGTAIVYLILSPQRFTAFRVAPRTMTLLVFIAAWQLISALMVGHGLWSYYWALGNIVAFWGFAVAFLLLAGHREYRSMITRIFIVIAVVIALWSVLEFVTQAKLVTYRNLYADDPTARGFSYLMRRQIAGAGEFPYMSLGPYFIHHTLAAVLCALGGFLIMGPNERNVRWHFMGSLLLTFAIFSTQSRSGILAFAAMTMVGLYLLKTWRSRFAVVGGGVMGLVLFIPLFGGVSDFATAFLHNVTSNASTTDIFTHLRSGLPNVHEEVGTAEGRFAGVMMLFSQVDQWWLFGTGPGSMFNQERILPGIVSYSEQGSFIWFMVESGLPVGIALIIVMAASLRQGLCSVDWRSKSAALGLGGFWIFSLIHIGLQSWVIGMVLIGLIEAWSRQTTPQHAIQLPAG